MKSGHLLVVPNKSSRMMSSGIASFFLAWGLPTILPIFLYPLALWLSSQNIINSETLLIFDLRLASLSALLVLFGFRALPGFALLVLYNHFFQPALANLSVLCQLTAACVSYLGYFHNTGRRAAASFGKADLTYQRIFWLTGWNSLLYLTLTNMVLWMGLTRFEAPPLDTATLVNLLGVMNGCLTGIPFICLLLRPLRSSTYLRGYVKMVARHLQQSINFWHFLLWSGSVLILMKCLTTPAVPDRNTIFSTFYSLLFLLPLMIWAVIRTGHAFTAPLWATMLIILGKHNGFYIPLNGELMLYQVLVSAMLFIFSLTIVVMGIVSRASQIRLRQLVSLSRTDPMTAMPNLRALTVTLKHHPDSVLCMINTPELDLFTQRYGLHFRTQYQKALREHLRPLLSAQEALYMGCNLLLRLGQADSDRLYAVFKFVNSFRFIYDNQSVGLSCGLAYCRMAQTKEDVYHLMGKLTRVAALSLSTGKPENMQKHASQQQDDMVHVKSNIRIALQQALDCDEFILMAQPIVSTRGKTRYHEILLRMKDKNGEFISPAQFLPVAAEASLMSEVDLWVLKNTLKTIKNTTYKDDCFAINLMPSTVSRPGFAVGVQTLLTFYGVAPEQIIFEVTEVDTLSDSAYAKENLRILQTLGCRVAIDDFGTGYASYARLIDINADILKIDGSFIRRIPESELNRYIVESFIHVAQLRDMDVVAEYVENAKIKASLDEMNIDWLQGDYTGRPVPLLSLVIN